MEKYKNNTVTPQSGGLFLVRFWQFGSMRIYAKWCVKRGGCKRRLDQARGKGIAAYFPVRLLAGDLGPF